MRYVSLNGEWELVERPLSDGAGAYEAAASAAAEFRAQVPGDVNDAVFRAGRLPEPLAGLNFREYSKWIPQRSWWHRRAFEVPADAGQFAELELDGLDVHADIWLNGVHLGHHATAFCPFTADVSAVLKRGGKNLLVVRVTTGRELVEHITREAFPLLDAVSTEEGRGYPDRGMKQRIFLRKPAYSWGWDWSPALPTCGITGNCGLRFYGVNRVERVRLDTSLEGGRAHVRARVELYRRSVVGTAWGKVSVRLTDEDGNVSTATVGDVLVRSGVTFVDVALDVAKPRLWWPNGAGGQHRYTVEAALECEGENMAYPAFRWGMRTVAMDVRPGVFRFLVNGRPLFIQGGNWVPCDHLCGRTTPERLARLVGEAAAANFNCLRVWGGGRYELDAFFDACDEKGILLWHDFMAACSPLPYDEADVAALFRREAEWQARRLCNRACMLLWCGNNEVGACYEWAAKCYEKQRDPAWPLYFEELPRIVAAETSLPYWPTSPYGGERTGDPRVGDDHHWVVMRPDTQFWSTPEYWDSASIPIFNSEYGYGGPCCLASTRDYLGTDAPDLLGALGREHTNTFYDIPRVNFSIEQHYRKPAPADIRDYIRLGGLCQGLNYGYSLESMRAHNHNWGGIFWMYNDAWGENGWTIIDYYLRRKISFYFVKRALAPLRLILRRGGRDTFGGRKNEVLAILINATPHPRRGTLRVGFMRYDGAKPELQTVKYDVPAFSRGVVAACPAPTAAQLRHGTVVAQETKDTLPSATWRHAPCRELNLPPAKVTATATVDGADLVARVRADSFAHAVHFDIPDDFRLSDCWFDLLPGETRDIRIFNAAALPLPLRAFCENN